MAHATELPLTFAYHHLDMTAHLNGQPATLILDTGAEETTLVKAAARRLSLRLESAGTSTGIGGSTSRYVFVAKTFQIGGLHGKHFTMAASDYSLGPPGSGIDGLLGVDFLAAYDLDLDLPEHKAILFTKVAGCTTASAYLTGPLYSLPMLNPSSRFDYRPLVPVQIGGKRLIALIDSGAQGTAIFRNSARRLGLNLDRLTTDRRLEVGGIGPDRWQAVRHVLTPITIGDLTISNLPVDIIDQHSFDDADMLLGLDFLSRVHVWFNFSAHTLIMQFPPAKSPS